MQITKHIHALKIPFRIFLGQDKVLERFVYVYLIFGREICLVDCGVDGAERIIFDYIVSNGRKVEEISKLILTHAHPDHIGTAASIKQVCECELCVHEAEAEWVGDIEKQFRERPVPGFFDLVGGSAHAERLLKDGDLIDLDGGSRLEIIHTPGHSKGSVSIIYEEDSSLFTGDALILPGEMPIYDDIAMAVESIRKLQELKDVDILFSSWEAPIEGCKAVDERVNGSLEYLKRIHETVLEVSEGGRLEPMELCKQVVERFGLPAAAVNPLVAKGFASSLDKRDLFV